MSPLCLSSHTSGPYAPVHSTGQHARHLDRVSCGSKAYRTQEGPRLCTPVTTPPLCTPSDSSAGEAQRRPFLCLMLLIITNCLKVKQLMAIAEMGQIYVQLKLSSISFSIRPLLMLQVPMLGCQRRPFLCLGLSLFLHLQS